MATEISRIAQILSLNVEKKLSESTAMGGRHVSVHLCREQASGKPVVLKHYFAPPSHHADELGMLQYFADCPHTLQIVPEYLSKMQQALSGTHGKAFISEYMEGGDLFSYIAHMRDTMQIISEFSAKRIFFQVATMIKHMHDRDYVHRDIKPENILLSACRTVAKLSDFEFTVKGNAEGDAEWWPGYTPGFESPEVVSLAAAGHRQCPTSYRHSRIPTEISTLKAADCWALGASLFITLAQTFPFGRASTANIAGWVYTIQRNHSQGVKWTDAFSQYSPEAKSVIECLLNLDESLRWTIDDFLNCSWLDEVRQGQPEPSSQPSAPQTAAEGIAACSFPQSPYDSSDDSPRSPKTWPVLSAFDKLQELMDYSSDCGMSVSNEA